MSNALWKLQEAVYAVLSADSTLSNMVSGVFSHVPQDAAYPYISFGSLSAEEIDSYTQAAFRTRFSLNVYSRYRGSKEALEILAEIRRILQDPALDLGSEWQLAGMRFVHMEVQTLLDRLTWEGVIHFFVVIQEI